MLDDRIPHWAGDAFMKMRSSHRGVQGALSLREGNPELCRGRRLWDRKAVSASARDSEPTAYLSRWLGQAFS
jgi:hypothetical protein